MPKRINLYGTIVASDDAWFYEWLEMDHTTPRLISDHLTEANGEDVDLYVNSPGGDVWAGSEIYTALREYGGNVTAKVVAIAASAASVAICGAKTVMVSPTAQVMVHRSSTGAWGNKTKLDQASQMLDSVDEGMVNAYEHKTGKSREELLSLMDGETFLNAQQALEKGFADEIMFAQTEKVVASAAAPLFSNEVMNKIKSKLIKANLAPGDKGKENNPEPVANATTNIKPLKEEKPKMDFIELKEQHPELFAQITNEAQTAERTRISSLQAIATAPGAAPFINDAIANGETAADVAMKMVQASIGRNNQEGIDRANDAKDSNVDMVNAQEATTPDAFKEENTANTVANMVAMAQNIKSKNGGRK